MPEPVLHVALDPDCKTVPRCPCWVGAYALIAPVTTEGDTGVRPYAVDAEIAKRLWAWSERWI